MDDTDPGADSDLRRRAGWLLAMLAVVAVLFVVVMTTVIGTDNGGGAKDTPGALDRVATSQPAPSHTGSSHHPKPSRTASASASRSPTTSTPPTGTTSCPTQETCILQGDVGNGVAAINQYRTKHGLPAVAGDVSAKAQTCAVHNGSGCSGGWAETELAKPDGAEAVQKILPFAHLTDTQMKSVEVGWAYDPSAKLYYFAIIRND